MNIENTKTTNDEPTIETLSDQDLLATCGGKKGFTKKLAKEAAKGAAYEAGSQAAGAAINKGKGN